MLFNKLLGCSLLLATAASAQSFKITTCDEYRYQDKNKEWQWGIGKPVSEFPATPTSGATVYFLYETKPEDWKPGQALSVKISRKTPDGEMFADKQNINPSYKPKKPGEKLYYHSGFQVGDYIIRVVDMNDEDKVYYTGKFYVKMTANPINATGTVWVCDHTDDDWNPVGATLKLKAGSCANFLLKMPQKLEDVGVIGWVIYKVKPDGTDGDFVDEYEMAVPSRKGRFFATTTQLCIFKTRGKYRVYANDWYSTKGMAKSGNLNEYYGKTEVTVE